MAKASGLAVAIAQNIVHNYLNNDTSLCNFAAQQSTVDLNQSR